VQPIGPTLAELLNPAIAKGEAGIGSGSGLAKHLGFTTEEEDAERWRGRATRWRRSASLPPRTR
jgi:hypothetical protein